MRRVSRKTWWVLPAVLGSVVPVSADVIVLHNGGKISGVKVTALKGSDLWYRHKDRTRVKAVRDIKMLHLDGVPDLKEAETLLRDERYGQAVEAFNRARKVSAVEWQKKWIDLRLIPALDHAGRFTEAVERYLSAIKEFPLEAGRLRPKNVPRLPADQAKKLTAEIKSLRAGLASRIASDALEALVLDIRQAGGAPSTEAASSAPGVNAGAPGDGTPGAPSTGNRTASDTGVATLLTKVRIALRNNQHTKASALLDLAIDRAGQDSLAQAYFLKGRLVYEQVNENEDLLRAGWWFARVLAHYKNGELTGPALYYLASIQKRTGHSGQALALLRESRDAPMLSPDMRAVIDKTLTEWSTSK